MEILTYSPSTDSIIQPDPTLIQLSILSKICWKDFLRLYLGSITVLLKELKETGANSLPVFSFCLTKLSVLFDI